MKGSAICRDVSLLISECAFAFLTVLHKCRTAWARHKRCYAVRVISEMVVCVIATDCWGVQLCWGVGVQPCWGVQLYDRQRNT